MQALGNDGRWHEWSDLTEEEKAVWRKAMTLADERHERRKAGYMPLTVKESLLEYERDHMMDNL